MMDEKPDTTPAPPEPVFQPKPDEKRGADARTAARAREGRKKRRDHNGATMHDPKSGDLKRATDGTFGGRDRTTIEGIVIGMRAEGASMPAIARNLDCSSSTVQKIIRKYEDEISLKQAQLRNAALDRVAGSMDTQFRIANDETNRRSPDAFGKLSEIAFPKQGGGVNVNLAGRDIVQPGAQVANVGEGGLAAKVFARPIKEINEEIAKIEAEFERPAAPEAK